jgi:tetraacyldisaccharide 4'-kinase
MHRVFRRWIEAVWYPNARQCLYAYPLQMLFFLILSPFSLLYAFISLVIQYTAALKERLKFGYRSPVPVIVVGNFTVGGTGKTPLVAYLCEKLRQQGFQPGIISRGYGRKTSGVLVVTENLSSHTVGDEALLMFKLRRAPMVVGNNRNQAIQTLLSTFPTVNVIISDDGLQHAALQADIRILVIDAARGFGNAWCLPAGPLRAPRGLGKFSRAAMVVINETALRSQNTKAIVESFLVPTYSMQFEALGFINITPGVPYCGDTNPIPVTDFIKTYRGQQVHAVAGIGNPARFFASLGDLGLSITRHTYPDHHDFTPEDLTFKTPAPIIMTEKDAVKCAPFLSHGDCWALKIRVTIEEHFSGKVGQLIKDVQFHSGSGHDR